MISHRLTSRIAIPVASAPMTYTQAGTLFKPGMEAPRGRGSSACIQIHAAAATRSMAMMMATTASTKSTTMMRVLRRA